MVTMPARRRQPAKSSVVRSARTRMTGSVAAMVCARSRSSTMTPTATPMPAATADATASGVSPTRAVGAGSRSRSYGFESLECFDRRNQLRHEPDLWRSAARPTPYACPMRLCRKYRTPSCTVNSKSCMSRNSPSRATLALNSSACTSGSMLDERSARSLAAVPIRHPRLAR